MSRPVTAAWLAAVLALGSACGGSGPDSQQPFDPPPPPPPTAVRLSFPSTPWASAGQVMSPVYVYVLDEHGAQTSATVPVTVTASVGDLSGTTTRAATGGVAIFDDLVLTRAGSTTLIATATGLAGAETYAFTVAAGPIASLTFDAQPPATVTAGTTLPDVKVAARDAWGNLTNGNPAELVTVSVSGSVLLGPTVRGLQSGVATFSGLSLPGAGSGMVLLAATGAVGPIASTRFDVLPGAADRLVYGVEPWSVDAGELLVPAVEVRVIDAYGNLVPASRDVTVATATLGGTTTVATVGGIATFADLRVTLAGWHDLVASADGIGSVSATFQVQPAAAAALDFVAQPPAAVTAGSLFPGVVSVGAFDAYGNRVSGDSFPVTLSLTGAELFGTPTGYLYLWSYNADFPDLSVRKAGTGYRLTAAGRTGLAPGLSSAFDVVAGVAHHLAFTTQPATAVAGATLAPVSVSVVDGWGNATSAYGSVAIEFSASSSGAPAIYGTTTRPLVAGAVTFGDLSIRVAGQRYVLGARFTGGGLNGSSDAFDILAGPATQLAFLAQPARLATRTGQPITPAIQVAITDAWQNVAPADDRDVTLALEPNADGAVLAGTTTVATVARVARFDGLTVETPGTGLRIRASATGLADGLSSPLDVSPNWASIGPDGGDVTAVAADPGVGAVAYAAAAGCVWKTTDGATTWTRACRGLGLQALQIDALAVHPFRSQTVLAATSNGLYRSDDGGGTWSQVSSLGAATPYRTLAVAIAGSGAIYAGTYQDGLWRSDDEGATWAKVAAGLPSRRITAIAFEPASSEVLYAAGVDPSEVGTVYRSSDRGDTWTETALGPATVDSVKPTALLVDPNLADTIYVGTQTGLYESYDRGASFTQALWDADVRDLATTNAAGRVRYAAATSGLFRKVVGGGWTACTGLPASPKVVAVAVRADGAAFAGTRYGPYQSTNQGASWTSRTTGLRAFDIGAVGVGATGGVGAATVYAATTGGGVYRSLNGGTTWIRGSHPAEGQSFYGIAVEPANPSRAWLVGAGGLYRTTDSGATWVEVLTSQGTMYATVLDPSNDAIVYGGGNNDVYRSTVGTTASFRDLNVCSGPARALALSATAPLALWVGGDAGLCRVDLARVNDVFVPYAFQPGTSGLTDAIAVDPDPALAGSTVWASTSQGFHTTLDGGATWTKTSGRFNALLAQRGRLFGAPSLGGLSVSSDGGVTFGPAGVGFPPASIVRALADVSQRPDEIYAGTVSGSVYKTTSGGR